MLPIVTSFILLLFLSPFRTYSFHMSDPVTKTYYRTRMDSTNFAIYYTSVGAKCVEMYTYTAW